MKGTTADLLIKYLEKEGVEYIFGVPGGHLLPLYDAIYKNSVIKPVLTCHEAGAAFMAYGYAKTAGKIGVCCGTVGPGATNLITGVASAFMDSIPLLVITAQVGTTTIGKGALQEGAGAGRTISHVKLFESITKMSTMETEADHLMFTLRRALRIATTGRPGPVHIDLPANVQKEIIEEEILPISAYRPHCTVTVPKPTLKEIANLLNNAKNPAILVGAGHATGKGINNLTKLAEKFSIPVSTSLRAKGEIAEDHPLALGCVGLYGTKAANAYLRNGIDVLLVLGASLHEFTTHVWDPLFQPSKALIQVDIDEQEFSKNYITTLAIPCDCRSFVNELLTEDSGRKQVDRIELIKKFRIKKEYFAEHAMRSNHSPIKPQRLMYEISNIMPSNTVYFVDIGNTLAWAERYLCCKTEGQFITLSGLAAMGSATAACIGGKLGYQEAPVVCLCGDGDFHMLGMEISTAVKHKIPVIWIILKNKKLGMIKDIQGVSYQGRYIASDLGKTNFSELAKALGANSFHTMSPEEFIVTLKKCYKSNITSVIEVSIDSDETPPLKPRMLALKRSMGLPDTNKSISWKAIKSLWQMTKEK